jgi:phosphomevalonate kinase
VRPVALPPGLTLLPVWTGQPADTRALVTTMRELHDRDRAEYLALVAGMVPPASAVIEACENGDAAAAVEALGAAGEALAALGRAAGVDLETETVRELARRAAPWGGRAKATGAGGGDIALVAFADPGAAAGFRDEIAGMGINPLDLRVDPVGVSLERA